MSNKAFRPTLGHLSLLVSSALVQSQDISAQFELSSLLNSSYPLCSIRALTPTQFEPLSLYYPTTVIVSSIYLRTTLLTLFHRSNYSLAVRYLLQLRGWLFL